MENTNFAEEFEGTEALENEQVATDAPEVVKAPKERETFELADGSIGSRAAFIREKFTNDNMSRKQIAEQFGIVCMSRNGLSTQQIIEEDELLRQLKSYIRIVELPQQYQSVSSSYVRELLRQERWEEAAHLLHPSLVQRRHLLRGNL